MSRSRRWDRKRWWRRLVLASWMPRILRHDAADFGGGVELALTLAALSGEVPHQVFVSIAEDVVAICAVLGEVERFVLERWR